MGKLIEQKELTEIASLLDLIHLVDVDDTTDSPEGTSVYTTLALLKNLFHDVGFFDYNDLDTTSNPIAITALASPVKLTNDEAGSFTNKAYAPEGVTDVWIESIDEFDWSQLALGDMVDIRVDLSITTTQPNQILDLELRLAVGAGEYTIPFSINSFKTAGVQRIVAYNGIYMGDANTLDNGAYFEVSSLDNASCVVNGWYVKITRK